MFIYGELGRSATATALAFHDRFPNRPQPSAQTVRRIVKKFVDTGNVERKNYATRDR